MPEFSLYHQIGILDTTDEIFHMTFVWNRAYLSKPGSPDHCICMSLVEQDKLLAVLLDKDVCACCNATASVGEKFLVCGSCRCTYYCSPECQKKDWKVHRSTRCEGMKEIMDFFAPLKAKYTFETTNKQYRDLARVWHALNMATLENLRVEAGGSLMGGDGVDYVETHAQSIYEQRMQQNGVRTNVFLYHRSKDMDTVNFTLLDEDLLLEHCEGMRDVMLEGLVPRSNKRTRYEARYWVDLCRGLRRMLERSDGKKAVLIGFFVGEGDMYFWPVLEMQGGCVKQLVLCEKAS